MILTSMPDLPPRPLTAANAAFRRMFYERWGRENAIVCGSSCHVAYETHPQTLSIKTAWGGSERYFLREREVAVDDDHWLVLNEGREYGSVLKAARPAVSFSIFFRAGLQHEVAAAFAQPLAGALEDPQEGRTEFRFAEHLRPHDDAVSMRVRALQAAVQGGEREQDWLDQQLLLLLGELLTLERRTSPPGAEGRSDRRGARHAQAELHRRLHLAADFIDSCHREPIALDDMARVACLSRYHFVRHFRELHGLTPYAYLLRKRARAAQRLFAAGETDRELVAQQVGFGSRFALARAMRRHPLPG